MHLLRRYRKDGLNARGWSPAELAHGSGLTRQGASQLLNEDREHLPQVSKREASVAVARVSAASRPTVSTVAIEAVGHDRMPVQREAVPSTASTEQIVQALAVRLGVGLGAESGDGHGRQSAPLDRDDNAGRVVARLPAMAGEARRRTKDPHMPADLAAQPIRRTSRTQETREPEDQGTGE